MKKNLLVGLLALIMCIFVSDRISSSSDISLSVLANETAEGAGCKPNQTHDCMSPATQFIYPFFWKTTVEDVQ